MFSYFSVTLDKRLANGEAAIVFPPVAYCPERCHNLHVLGNILGLGSAAAFAANMTIARRGLLRASSSYIANISIFIGVPFFLLAAAIAGDLFRLDQISWRGGVFFALSGAVHFVLGRTWGYRSVQLIGATRANIITGLNVIVTIALAMLIFHETITSLMVFGILLSLSGPLLIAMKEQRAANSVQSKGNPPGKDVDRGTLYKGILYGMGAAVFWGSSAIFVKLGLDNGAPPVAGNLIAYVAASVVISPSALLNRKNRKTMLEADRRSLRLAILTGLTVSIAQLLRYLGLAYGSVILVSIMIRTNPLWLLLFAFTFNRKYESFSRWVLLGNALVLIGVVLVLI